MYVNNSNVKLGCSRLLFNIVYEIKRQIIFNNNNNGNNNELIGKLKKIIESIYKYFDMNKNNNNGMHVATVYRLMCIFGFDLFWEWK